MKTMKSTLTSLLFAAALSPLAWGQNDGVAPDEMPLNEINLGGPRIGLTYLAPGGEFSRRLLEENIGNKKYGTPLSQFGWEFEYLVVPTGGGPAFAIKLVPLIAGVEYGTFIPSASLVMGIRVPGGFEFGMGPNVVLTPDGLKTALVLGIGKSINYGGVSIPLDLVYTTGGGSNRVTFLFGYALRKSRK